MSCGLPSILSKIPMHLEIVKEYKEFVEYFDVNSKLDMYQSLIKIMELNYDILTNKCSKFINEKFSSKKMAEQYHNAYEKILVK